MSLLHYWDTQRSVKRRKTSEKDSGLEVKIPPAQEERPLSPSSSSGAVDSPTPAPLFDEPTGYMPSSPTELETSLPILDTDEDAIKVYESCKLEPEADEEPGLHARLRDGVWHRGKSSIYVDAFNLALETVLDEESHLFDDAETEVFRQWKDLSYESQYLYVRLFLRKTSAWHRISRLGYYSDIADLSAVATDLQKDRTLPKVDEQTPNAGDILLKGTFRFADGTDEITTLEEASSLLLLDEVKAFAKEVKAQGKNKKELLAALCEASQSQTGLGFKDQPGKRDGHLLQKILDFTGQCIRLTPEPRALFERVHLVFYRSTEWTEKSLTTIILAKISRRNFPQYIVCRSNSIFSSRAALLEFESAIRTQFDIDNILEFNGPPSTDSLQRIIDLADQFYPRWRQLVDEEQRKEDSIYESGEGAYLRRFSPAWVYTRVMHKSLLPLGRFKEHKREHELLSELLDQRLFHASRRGAWYQRKALLEEHYMWALTPCEGRSEENQRKFWKRVALRTCEEGLEDPLCHLIYHYDLQKRISKLERALRVVKREQHDFGHVMLSKPAERTIEGIRIESEDGPKKGKATVWIDEREGGECRVESMCLSWYRDHGWKGYHSEGGIVRTLFGLLFYDILFTYVPNVFQTPFQTCPLDLHTDVFYPSRASEINHRLVEITNGDAERIIRDIYDRESAAQPCAIGIDWSFELGDLIEIVQCFRGEALATICKVMAQEYQQRGGGIPDLFLWKAEEQTVLFSEVKSENDRLSDTQRLWIHILLGAGVQVELCNAVAREVRTV
ncbi:Fanconi-associated nuclease [Penicillium ucsense]|uniref:Fanconi-associated nuclease n=1 Tax=Penicillium ucsense TaxID=2839758 RepID=A0A8J8WGK7_9EURO|nr:Fanconi-associated nuclease [Penicillium ucsense]KAF7733708.1 Fanconi-associated nuclease [Penicillium ucsense]